MDRVYAYYGCADEYVFTGVFMVRERVGAAIGDVVGSSGGFLYGKHKEAEQAAYERGLQQGHQGQ
jgi:hypothetical protein